MCPLPPVAVNQLVDNPVGMRGGQTPVADETGDAWPLLHDLRFSTTWHAAGQRRETRHTTHGEHLSPGDEGHQLCRFGW